MYTLTQTIVYALGFGDKMTPDGQSLIRFHSFVCMWRYYPTVEREAILNEGRGIKPDQGQNGRTASSVRLGV